ncbi:MAG: hypothetical protein QXE31_03750 [Candidatus Woesearchaeota archaeon]
MKTVVIVFGIVILLLTIISSRNILMNDFNILKENTKEQSINQNINVNNNANLNNINNQDFGFQNVNLIINAKGNYELQPSVLKKDVPVKMLVDLNSVYGCARSIVIPQFNVFKNVRQGDNIIEFTPTKEGRIRIQCSMNMYVGYFDVVSDDSKIDESKNNELKTQSYENTKEDNNEEKTNQDNNQTTRIGCGCGGRF